MSHPAPDSLGFAYWTDPLCVWAWAEQGKLDRVLEIWGDRLDVDYRMIPVFGSFFRRFERGPWAGGGREGRAEATRRIAREHGPVEVSGEVWLDPGLSSSWPACEAVKAVALLVREGEAPPEALARYLWTVRQRFFVENQPMWRRDALLGAAGDLGIDPAAVAERLDDGRAAAALWEDHQDCAAQGLRGSPTYVFDGGRAVIYGHFDYEVLRGTIEALLKGAQAHGSAC